MEEVKSKDKIIAEADMAIHDSLPPIYRKMCHEVPIRSAFIKDQIKRIGHEATQESLKRIYRRLAIRKRHSYGKGRL